MSRVFIGGSRRISRLNSQISRRLEELIESGTQVLVGDANGADKAVQRYLATRGYRNVEVFYTAGECRNNLGLWESRPIPSTSGYKNLDHFAAKDRQMALEADDGLMIWDAKSVGTILNVSRLASARKNVTVFRVPDRQVIQVESKADLAKLLDSIPKPARRRVEDQLASEGLRSAAELQPALL